MHKMNRLLIILSLVFLASKPGLASREITGFDIARWYLDVDLVFICTVKQIDTIYIGHYDSISTDNIRESYDVIQEIYLISMDSLIKGDLTGKKSVDSVKTPAFLIHYSKTREIGKVFSGFDAEGDSIFQIAVRMFDDDAYFDNSYFRLKSNTKHLVILTKASEGYVIDYESECDENILELIGEIKAKGESYFTIPPDIE